jgi:hypothetical protein
MLGLLCALPLGCGGDELKPTTDPDAIKREQERLGGQIPGASKNAKDDAIKREQDRLKSKP